MKLVLAACATLLLAGCVSAPTVDLEEPSRLLGREADVRLDAQVFAEQLGTGSAVRMTWEIENQRPEPIAVADIVPAVSWDSAERTLVIHLGSEVPGNALVPRLVEIAPGEKRGFGGVAKVNIVLPPRTPLNAYPQSLQVRLSFLSNTEPFRELIGIPETAIADSALADRLFTQWVESNETIRTNAIPIDWRGKVATSGPDASRRR